MYVARQKFYLEYRMALGFAKADPDDDSVRIPKSLEEWERVKSTKIDVCARICKHLLTRDDAPDISFEDGVPVFPPIPEVQPGEVISREHRILIYQEFIAHGPLLSAVSAVYAPKAGHASISTPGLETLWR